MPDVKNRGVKYVMENIVEIDGKKFKLKANNQTPFIYRRYFRKDFFQELSRSFNGIPTHLNINDSTDRELIAENMNTTFFYELVWVLAKTANRKIPKMKEWLQNVPEASILELAVDASDMVIPLIKSVGKR